jgi:hypothetical protein
MKQHLKHFLRKKALHWLVAIVKETAMVALLVLPTFKCVMLK